MKKTIFIGLIAVLVVFGAVIYTHSKESRPELLTIGAIAGVSGEYGAFGENWQNGVRLAHELHQSDPSAIRVKLLEEDSEWDIKKGISAYNKLKNVHNIDALINLGTFTMNGIYDQVVQENFPVMQGGEQSIDPEDDNVFQIMPGSIALEEDLGEYVKDEGYTNIALFYTQEATFEKFASAFKGSYGGQVIDYPLPPTENDFRTDVTKALSRGHDAVVILAFPTQGAQVLNKFVEFRQTPPQLIFDVTFGLDEYKRILHNPEILEGSIVMTLQQTTTEEFTSLYQEKYGKAPEMAADWGFDAYNLLLSTYSTDGKKWIQNVRSADHDGASGEIIFNSVGVRLPQTEIKIVQNRELK